MGDDRGEQPETAERLLGHPADGSLESFALE
jgi:hypothetical protein